MKGVDALTTVVAAAGLACGVAFEWSTDDLDYGARYLMGLRMPFVVKEPTELKEALRRLAQEAGRIADIA